MHENYDIASECGIVTGWTMRGAKLKGEGPAKSLRKQESEARKKQKTQSTTKSGELGPQQDGYDTTTRVLNRE